MSAAELFHRAGVALFGEQYVAPLARMLGVEKDTVGKWRAGKSTVAPGVWLELRSALDKQHDLVLEAAAEVAAYCRLNRIGDP